MPVFSSRHIRQMILFASMFAGLPITNLCAQGRFGQADGRSRGVAQSSLSGSWQGSSWLGGPVRDRQEWHLGVSGSNTETGVIVSSVAPGSAGNRVRIEPGDVIVCVDGYQVGLIAGRLYDLDEELTRRADPNGGVPLLIQDHRSGRLASVRVQLDAKAGSTVSGTLVYRGRTPLPSDAIVTVVLENVSRPYYVVRNGQYSFPAPQGNRIPFEIDYDPQYINGEDTYRVRAFVSSRSRTILDTPQPRNVITKGNPSRVDLELVTVATSLASNGSNSGVISAGYPNYNSLDDRLIALYQQYLHRRPTTLELAALRQTPGIESRLATLPLELMAAQEYYDLAGNYDQAWLENVFQVIVKRKPTPSELDQWMRRYADLRYSRTELLRQLYAQVH